jgi:hypothetical protein
VGAAQHLDALHPTGAGIVGDFEVRLHLNHGMLPFLLKRSGDY